MTEAHINESVRQVFFSKSLNNYLKKKAIEMNINSAYLLIPVVLSSSFAFMFPISTLNNALVFNNKFFRMNDMVI
jgi:hypothetical protein